MKKSLLIALTLTALCADVSTLPAWADAPNATPEGSPKIHESQPAAPDFDPELDRLHKAGLSAYGRKDYAEAVRCYRQAAERGYAKSQFSLAVCYALGKGVVKSPAQAAYWLRQAAEQGYAKAQYGLGVCYDEGDGVAKDPIQAAYWQRKAAEQGVANAQFNLGLCYANGEGVAKDLTQAFYWFRQAAEQGVADAQLNVGVYYYKGKGVAKDIAQAVYWFRRAAEQGDAQAQFNVGICYANGEGVAKDPAQAAKWYRKAAEQGDAKAQYNLGTCYEHGEGVAKDTVQAKRWYRKAAEQGLAEAQLSLGCLYCSENINAETNIAEGKKWLQKAAARQDEGSQELAAIAKDILREIIDIETAIAEAKEWKRWLRTYLSNNTIEDKKYFAVLNEWFTIIDDLIAELFAGLHDTPRLIVDIHNQNNNAIQYLDQRHQSIQSLRNDIREHINSLKADTTAK